MKKSFFKINLILISIATVFTLHSCAITASESVNKEYRYSDSKRLTQDELEALKNTTTVFLLREADRDRLEEFQMAIYSTWSYTPIVVSFQDSINNFRDGNYSFFAIEGNFTETEKRIFVNVSLNLLLPMASKTKRGKIKIWNECFIKTNLHVTDSLVLDIWNNTKSGFFRIQNSEEENSKMFTEKIATTKQGLINWTPGHLALYLIDAQRQLKNKTRESQYSNWSSLHAVDQMKKSTLLIPNYAFLKGIRSVYSTPRRMNETKLLKKYPHKYEVIDRHDIYKQITKDEEIFILDVVRVSSGKFIKVFSTKQGLIYKYYKVGSRNLKSSDFEKLAR